VTLIPFIALLVGAAGAGTLTQAPKLSNFVEAEYPAEAAAAGLSGAVELALIIDETGEVLEARVVEPGPHPAFGPAALHAAALFRFEPAEIDGVPAKVEIGYRYEFVFRPAPPPAELPVVLQGKILERGTRNPVVGAVVEASRAAPGAPGMAQQREVLQSAETDAAGAFALRGIAPGPVQIRVVSPAHREIKLDETIEEGKRREVEYRITRHRYDPFETVVRGERERREVAVHSLKLEEVRTLPGTQGDLLKVLQNFPGVARSPFGIGLLVVRGSAPQDTKVYLDGVEVPLLFHFGGITSVVNSDMLESLDFHPGNFGSRFGRAMGGAIDVHTRQARKEGVHGNVNLDIFDGEALLEVPVGDGGLIASVRRSWVDQVLDAALPRIDAEAANELRVAPRYYDYQLKLDHPALGGNLSAMAFGSDDAMSFIQSQDEPGRPAFFLRTHFHRLAAHHHRSFGAGTRLRSTVALGYDGVDVNRATAFGVRSEVLSLTLREAVVFKRSERLSLELGVDAVLRSFGYRLYLARQRPPDTVLDSDGAEGDPVTDEAAEGAWLAPAIHAELSWVPEALPKLRLVPGLRVDHDSRLKRSRVWLDPRLAAFYQLLPGTTLTAAVGLYGEAPQPEEMTQTFGNPDLRPQRSVHYSLGAIQELPYQSRVELTGFVKSMDRLVAETRALRPDGSAKHLDNTGLGEVYGAELLLRRELAAGLFGWVAYTYSNSVRRDDPTVPGFPRWHPFQFDQRHILTMVLSYRTAQEWTFGTRIRGVSGSPYTPEVGNIYNSDSGRYLCVDGDSGSRRLPAFFQADVRVDKRWVFDKWVFSAYVDVQNVSNHENAEFYFENYDCSTRVALPGLPLFPSLGLRGEW
jgi:TonB family protein